MVTGVIHFVHYTLNCLFFESLSYRLNKTENIVARFEPTADMAKVEEYAKALL